MAQVTDFSTLLESPVFRAYLFYSAILVVKMMIMSPMTGMMRFSYLFMSFNMSRFFWAHFLSFLVLFGHVTLLPNNTNAPVQNFEKLSEFPNILNWTELFQQFLNLDGPPKVAETKNSTFAEDQGHLTTAAIKWQSDDENITNFIGNINEREYHTSRARRLETDDFSVFVVAVVLIAVKVLL
ncbi:hypothetical protein TcasGA2_TC009130 [Tribolium castaneum]|uniref:Uncharacterized protein n=1 Tax=Tribolium castaneum TaxID=7070 RepID=D6WU54_TRICA|nr:hypothetical protein TcasGA2_TC009130 [Tribolium castaneum]